MAKACRANKHAAHLAHVNRPNHNEKYFFDCQINGAPVTIRDVAKSLDFIWQPCEVTISGYAGGSIDALAETTLLSKLI